MRDLRDCEGYNDHLQGQSDSLKTLVSGATGFVGVNITGALAKFGHEIGGAYHSAPGMLSAEFLQPADASEVGRAFRALLLAPELTYDVDNLAGAGTTMQRLVECIASIVTRTSVEWVESPAAANISISAKPSRGTLDVSRLSTDARFVPEFTLEAGIRDFFAWLTKPV